MCSLSFYKFCEFKVQILILIVILYFPHIRLWFVFSVSRICRLILSIAAVYISNCLYQQLIVSSCVRIVLGQYFLFGLVFKFKNFIVYECFITDCQGGRLLGSKDLGLNIQNHICIVLANQEQNMSTLGFQAMLKGGCFKVQVQLNAEKGVWFYLA